MQRLALAVIQEVRQRAVLHFPAQVRACLGALTDEQIWSRPNDPSNSIGNLVLHVCGSARHFVGRGVGGGSYRRDRLAEFAERGPLPKADLLRILDETVAETDRVLAALSPDANLLDVSEHLPEPHTILSLLLRTSHHWGVHTGQIVYVAKSVNPSAVAEVWERTRP
jgi:hypothetical protein